MRFPYIYWYTCTSSLRSSNTDDSWVGSGPVFNTFFLLGFFVSSEISANNFAASEIRSLCKHPEWEVWKTCWWFSLVWWSCDICWVVTIGISLESDTVCLFSTFATEDLGNVFLSSAVEFSRVPLWRKEVFPVILSCSKTIKTNCLLSISGSQFHCFNKELSCAFSCKSSGPILFHKAFTASNVWLFWKTAFFLEAGKYNCPSTSLLFFSELPFR